ncbi:MAG: ribonuclease HI family protein [Clostridiales bacterium]|nr:ribonuclease HI family protein [Clostridiales bacterium]
MSEGRPACVIYTDGGARGNPGLAGAGWVLVGETGKALSSGGKFLGVATNNVAEYHGVICGLTAALAAGCVSVEVRSDSELIVRQMTGRYRVKNENLKPLFLEASALASRFTRVRFTHVRREDNRDADQMANDAMDAEADVGDAPGDARGPQGTLF